MPEKDKPLQLEPVSFSDLPGWGQDKLAGFSEAFLKSCDAIARREPERQMGDRAEFGTAYDWHVICNNYIDIAENGPGAQYAFFEEYLQPYSVRAGRDEEGLFTGYYEASLNGSRTRSGPYQIPLYQRPDDLVMVQLGDFRDDLKGRRIAGRVENGRLRPYESREEIVSGNWPHNDKVLVWVDDAVDAFFVQIQGSGRVSLDDGTVTRIGYAGQNGHPYYAIGRELIKRGALTKDNVSMQSIRAWLAANPEEAEAVMNTNRSYVFFQELPDRDGPIGGQGIPLTPLRSLAIDHSLFPYGLPFYTNIEYPGEKNTILARLMVGQDTGGAIRGPVRGDVFWGHGPEAEALAGIMASKGRYWVLLPKKR